MLKFKLLIPLINCVFYFMCKERVAMGVQIRRMFDGIATKYDFLNHFLSLGRDISWRKKAVRQIDQTERLRVLDLCGGTGDFLHEVTRMAQRPEDAVVGDFSHGMLSICKQKFDYDTVQLDAMNTPFPNQRFNVILNGFGMRNLDDTQAGVKEAYRLLDPNGQFITLEFFQPSNPFNFFFYKILAPLFIPLFGAIFSGKGDAYAYLVRSIKGFLKVKEYGSLCESEGFEIEKIMLCDGGLAYIVVAKKPSNE